MENLTDEKQIQDVIQNYSAAFANLNAKAVMSYLSENPKRIMNYDNKTAIGKEDVKATYVNQFKIGKKAELTFDVASIAISHNSASVNYNWRLDYTNLEDKEIRLTGKNIAKLIKVEDLWKLNEIEETINP